MLLLILLLFGLNLLLSLIGNANEDALNNYYKLESKQDILKKYKFCC